MHFKQSRRKELVDYLLTNARFVNPVIFFALMPRIFILFLSSVIPMVSGVCCWISISGLVGPKTTSLILVRVGSIQGETLHQGP